MGVMRVPGNEFPNAIRPPNQCFSGLTMLRVTLLVARQCGSGRHTHSDTLKVLVPSVAQLGSVALSLPNAAWVAAGRKALFL